MNDSTMKAAGTVFCPFLMMDDDVRCVARKDREHQPNAAQQTEFCITANSAACKFFTEADTLITAMASKYFKKEFHRK